MKPSSSPSSTSHQPRAQPRTSTSVPLGTTIIAGKLVPGPSRSVTRLLMKAGAAAHKAVEDTTKIVAMAAVQESDIEWRIEAVSRESQPIIARYEPVGRF